MVKGAGWKCASGEHYAQVYTPEDMLSLLQEFGQRIPQVPSPRAPSIENVRVYIEGTKEHPEVELDAQFVRMHTELTGALPVVGKPLSRRVDGIPYPFNVFTYGKVLRIECTQKQ